MNERLKELLADKSEEWKAGFFCAVNLTSGTKAAFLKELVGEQVVIEESDAIQGQASET